MVCFPNAKINLGLYITEKRSDGFHNIETVFYPINWKDSLEIIENKEWKESDEKCLLICYGIPIDGLPGQNLIVKAYHSLDQQLKLPPIQVHLFKNIPMGAGLGGGSADAAFFIKLINDKLQLNLSEQFMQMEASKLGSDCAFFIKNKPVFAYEKGNKFREIQLDLSNYSIFTIYPKIHSNTALAYSRVIPKKNNINLEHFISSTEPENWNGVLENDFEPSIFYYFPEIKNIKTKLYQTGAIYASLSGSGSAVYGIFKKNCLPDKNIFNAFLTDFTV